MQLPFRDLRQNFSRAGTQYLPYLSALGRFSGVGETFRRAAKVGQNAGELAFWRRLAPQQAVQGLTELSVPVMKLVLRQHARRDTLAGQQHLPRHVPEQHFQDRPRRR